MKKAETPVAHLTYHENKDLLNVEIKHEAEMTLTALREHYRIIRELTDNRQHFALVDVRNVYFIELDAMKYAATPEAISNRLAAAYYKPPLVNRLNINFLRVVHEPPIPLNIFSSREAALDWFESLKKEQKEN
jgi:hypothetical protein